MHQKLQTNGTLEWEDLNTNTHKLLVNESLMDEDMVTNEVQTKRPSLMEVTEREGEGQLSGLKLS